MQTSSWGCLIGIQFFGEGQTSNSNDSSNGKWFTLAMCCITVLILAQLVLQYADCSSKTVDYGRWRSFIEARILNVN
jgi:hypothetical protein